jgi:Ner family transcriptional regulator
MDDSKAAGQEDNGAPDWHPADVQAALKKRGLSLAGLSKLNGYRTTAAGKALKRPWPALEILIAEAIGLAPQDIWPGRYNSHRTGSVPQTHPIEKN